MAELKKRFSLPGAALGLALGVVAAALLLMGPRRAPETRAASGGPSPVIGLMPLQLPSPQAPAYTSAVSAQTAASSPVPTQIWLSPVAEGRDLEADPMDLARLSGLIGSLLRWDRVDDAFHLAKRISNKWVRDEALLEIIRVLAGQKEPSEVAIGTGNAVQNLCRTSKSGRAVQSRAAGPGGAERRGACSL